MAQCVIYWDENLSGNAHLLNASQPDLRNASGQYPGQDWNDETSSIKIISGTWRFYEHVNYQGASMQLGPGQYLNMHNFPVGDNQVSSIELVSE